MRRTSFLSAVVPCLTVAAVAACGGDDPLAPLPDGAREYTPPPVYARWLDEVHRCSGDPAGGNGVRWYYVRDRDVLEHRGRVVAGYYDPAGHRIVLAEGAIFDGQAVRHQFLHAIRRDTAHRRRDFLDSCGGMVECLWECVRDAGPPPPMPAGTVVVAPQALSVGVDVRPDSMLVGGADDWIAITVRVRNDGGTPVVVRTPRAWGDLDLRSFGFRASAERVAERYDEFMVDSSVIRFAPGEEKRWRMDVRARTFGAGRVSVRGVYVGQPSAQAAFAVLP